MATLSTYPKAKLVHAHMNTLLQIYRRTHPSRGRGKKNIEKNREKTIDEEGRAEGRENGEGCDIYFSILLILLISFLKHIAKGTW